MTVNEETTQVSVTVEPVQVPLLKRWFVHPKFLGDPASVSRLGAVVEWSQKGARGVITLASEATAAECAEVIVEEWRTAGFLEVKMAETWSAAPPNINLYYVMHVFWEELGHEEVHVGTTWQNGRTTSEICSNVLQHLNEQLSAQQGRGHLAGFNLLPENIR